ncbi:hypothetical protein CQ018_16405 [Arthrobacter sp. MYb227]|uniref:fluoride efflux transporter FluC n=1 Tax=Arthrobacter sp. MYb227 TaxID=1848601 RepID=UPI000CFAE240|nr:CrcB family protein [Arthrobacter sp. MYb227]PQZ88575.1 hypothetical protein CQ018_16405 [Arthrobacter sp. MYb227]
MQQRKQAPEGPHFSVGSLLAVALGGFLGAAARILLAVLIPENPAFPATTLAVNVTGTAALGFFSVYFAVHPRLRDWCRAGIGTGFLGAFTTFSTLVIFLLGAPVALALLYVGLSLGLCGLAAWLAVRLTEAHYSAKGRGPMILEGTDAREPWQGPSQSSGEES